jgi:zinc protease
MGKSEFSGYHPALLPERAIMSLVFVGDVKGASAIEQREQRWRLNALSSILGRRLRNRLREEMAVTYSVSAPVEFYYTPESRYMLTVSFIAAPEMIDSAAHAVWEEIKTLQAQGPTEAEATRAAQILRRQLENAGQDNLWWAGQLMRHEFNGMALESMNLGMSFTTADIRDAAIQYLSDKVYQQEILKSDKLKIVVPQRKNAN